VKWLALSDGKRSTTLRSIAAWIKALDTQFDVVIAGAIVEHLSNPIYAVGAWTLDEHHPDQELLMKPMTPWTDARFNYAWWALSEGLWRKLFDNVGFDFEWKIATAVHNVGPSGPQTSNRPSIIARKR
jgi:hypothetical protein